MMLEYTPHLLEREDVRNAFNNYQSVYADLVRKGDIYTSSCYIKKGESALIKPSEYTIPAGYMRVYTHVARERVNKEFMDAYAPLYDLIHAELLPHITKRSEIEHKQIQEKRQKYLIGVHRRRIEKYKKLIEHNQKAIEDLESK